MKTKFVVKGFHCKACGALVKDVAEDFSSIQSCSVDVKSGEVVIEHGPDLNVKEFQKEIESLGDYKIVG